MDAPNQPIDEYTLAAFIAGTLPDDRRDELVAYLAHNADARELLQMAYKALEASKRTDEPIAFPTSAEAPARHAARAAERPAGRTAARPAPSRPAAASRMPRFARYAGVAVLMFSIGLGLNLFLGNDRDALRSAPAETATLDVRVAERTLGLRWTPVPDAYNYRVVVFDPEAAEVVARLETTEHWLAPEGDFASELRSRLRPDRSYQLRIDAYSAQNRRLTSAVVEFTPEH